MFVFALVFTCNDKVPLLSLELSTVRELIAVPFELTRGGTARTTEAGDPVAAMAVNVTDTVALALAGDGNG